MKKVKTCNANFFNRWLNYKIEKLREIERLCSAIMGVLEIAEVPSWYGIRAKEIENDDCAGKKHSPAKGIDWGNMFDKLERGEKVIEYTDFRQWYALRDIAIKRLFYKGEPSDLDKEGYDHPLWIPIPLYGENIDSFQTIRDDCKMLSHFLESVNTTYNEQDFEAIEDTVNDVIQGAFTLIGSHDKENGITLKLREYEAREQADRERKAKGGRAPKKNTVILQAAIEFIAENLKRIEQPYTEIARNFKRKHPSYEPFVITVDSMKYEIFYAGKKICCSSEVNKGKFHDKTIAYSTFLARYIPEAKSIVISSASNKS